MGQRRCRPTTHPPPAVHEGSRRGPGRRSRRVPAGQWNLGGKSCPSQQRRTSWLKVNVQPPPRTKNPGSGHRRADPDWATVITIPPRGLSARRSAPGAKPLAGPLVTVLLRGRRSHRQLLRRLVSGGATWLQVEGPPTDDAARLGTSGPWGDGWKRAWKAARRGQSPVSHRNTRYRARCRGRAPRPRERDDFL